MGKSVEAENVKEVQTSDSLESSVNLASLANGTSTSDDMKESIDKLGFLRNGEPERALAEKMSKLHDQDPNAAEAAWRAGREYAGMRRTVSFDTAHMLFNDVTRLSEGKGSAHGWAKYDQMQANLKDAQNEKLDSPESIKKATEKLAEAFKIDPQAWGAGHRTLENYAGLGYQMLADTGLSKFASKALQVKEDAKTTAVIMNEEGVDFDQAYSKNELAKSSVAEARKILGTSNAKLDAYVSDELIKKAAEALLPGLKASEFAVGKQVGAGEAPLIEYEKGSPFFRAVQMSKEMMKSAN